ncbi:MAG: NAD(P)-dependent oxidoreductase [Gemmatimonadetes bacterium]|nr:NAD(P)-dependent oxidoreductase [Gemmatimonadota bacterium]
MKIAITGAAGFLGRALLKELAGEHEIRAIDLEMPGDLPEVERGDVLVPEEMEKMCQGTERVIHLARARWEDGLASAENEARIMDTRLKGSYNVMKAAGEGGVGRVIQISDLCVFSGYEEEVMVGEDFLPLPNTSAEQQAVYLSELIGREFARLYPGLVLTLRLGQLVEVGKLAVGDRFEADWLDLGDAVAAIRRGLEVDGYDGMSDWGLYDLAADVPEGRFSLLKITSGRFGFSPREDFAAWRKEAAV